MTRFIAFLYFILLISSSGFAQQDLPAQKILKVAIVAPLYLDSAFENGLIKENLPKYMMPGIEFIQGAEIALDTINTNGRKVEAFIVDSKATTQNLQWMMQYGGLDKMDLIIGGVKEPEYQELALFTKERNIPFVSAIYPNDGGIRNDSSLIIVNSTLQSNVEGIYSYIVQKHSLDQILLIKQRNDNRIDNMFRQVNRSTGKDLLKIKTVAVDSIDASQLAMLIDTLKPAVVIGATLNEWFTLNTADACYPYRSKLTLIGMPNWDGFRDLYDKERYKDFQILFTTPHHDEKKNSFSHFLGNEYFTKYRSRPEDMAVKGFESTYYFINLLLNYNGSFFQHLNENQFACFHDFNFRPVDLDKNEETDYYENKHVFIMQILNGMISKIW